MNFAGRLGVVTQPFQRVNVGRSVQVRIVSILLAIRVLIQINPFRHRLLKAGRQLTPRFRRVSIFFLTIFMIACLLRIVGFLYLVLFVAHLTQVIPRTFALKYLKYPVLVAVHLRLTQRLL